ncbi:3-hydroxyanthranilic acid dioxygenase domain-containing protein [Ditylenchus destructor]|nr:3-hydroxyanthranilic acid dioxygenase domain-containing protein [Ditylenchus destructor]
MSNSAVNVQSAPDWIEANRSDFSPPVCNKCMFNGQLFAFFVGGPNQRMDFHLEVGEELFYQVEGDMTLKIIEKNNKLRDIPIKQGEIFLLPGRVQHCPQRPANTVGCVIERARNSEELDCLRYYDDGIKNVLFERWFHLNDVVKDLPPIMREFREKKVEKQCKVPDPPAQAFQPNFDVHVPEPILLSSFIDGHLEEINTKSPYQLYGPPVNRSLVLLYGQGQHKVSTTEQRDMVIMTLRGEVNLKTANDNKSHNLQSFHMAHLKPNTSCDLNIPSGGVCITVQMP